MQVNSHLNAQVVSDPVTLERIEQLHQLLEIGHPEAELLVVGGAVRDFLFSHFHGLTPRSNDIDLACNLTEQQIVAALSTDLAQGFEVKIAQKQSETFGVVFCTIQGHQFEIAPFRRDIGSADGRHPEAVVPGTLAEDAARRDLTINALFWNPRSGRVIDLVGGVDDIRQRTIRTVGNPADRFNEDRLRVLRLVRFFSRFNSGDILTNTDQQTIDALWEFNPLEGISAERIQQEVVASIQQAISVPQLVQNWSHVGLLPAIFPDLLVDTASIGRLCRSAPVVLAWLLRHNEDLPARLLGLCWSSDVTDRVHLIQQVVQFARSDNAEGILSLVRLRNRLVNQQASLEVQQQQRSEVTSDLLGFADLIGGKVATVIRFFADWWVPVPKVPDEVLATHRGAEIGRWVEQQIEQQWRESVNQNK